MENIRKVYYHMKIRRNWVLLKKMKLNLVGFLIYLFIFFKISLQRFEPADRLVFAQCKVQQPALLWKPTTVSWEEIQATIK